MTKTLSVSITDMEKVEHLTISGTLHEQQFNERIVLGVGQTKIALNSAELAQALKVVVDFQKNENPLNKALIQLHNIGNEFTANPAMTKVITNV